MFERKRDPAERNASSLIGGGELVTVDSEVEEDDLGAVVAGVGSGVTSGIRAVVVSGFVVSEETVSAGFSVMV